MSRLTGINNDYCFTICGGERKYIREDCNIYKVCFERQMYEKLKHYEDLEEEGRLLIFPKGFDKEHLLRVLALDECIVHFGGKGIENCDGTNCEKCWEEELKGKKE